MLLTTDLTKDEICAKMRTEWKVDVTKLESKGDIIIRTTEECISQMACQIFSEQWHYGLR